MIPATVFLADRREPNKKNGMVPENMQKS
jgi:hypothetical protein